MELKRGILVTTSYTPPRLSTIEWYEERRAVVLVTKQDGEDQTGMSEAARRRPKHAIIPWNGDEETLEIWREKIAEAARLNERYREYVEGLSEYVELQHMRYLTKEEYDESRKAAKKSGT